MIEGRLAANVMQFGRILRRAGLPVGPADVLTAAAAMQCVDIASRAQVRSALHAAMVHRHEHDDLFEQAFRLFWRHPEEADRMAALALLSGERQAPEKPPPGSRRLAEALGSTREERKSEPTGDEIDAVLTVSEQERLQTMDFEAMSAAEIASAKAEISRLTLPLDLRRTRRRRPDPTGPILDLRGTLRASLRTGGEVLDLARARRTSRPPPLVVLCDISRSMARYAPILLHFLHAVASDRDRVHTFLFGTRLSNISRCLRHRDPEVAFQTVAHAVPDFSGGTRIGETLERFNRDWGRRVLGEGAVVLLITDGLDREGAAGLPGAMERLHHSCARLVWLNPLLRWDGFAPRSQSIRAMLPHVDEFRPVHNLASLRTLVRSLSRPTDTRTMDRWRRAA